MKTKVFTYIRVGAQPGAAFGQDEQGTALTLAAAEHDFCIVGNYSDTASGMSALEAREGMAAMLDALATGEAQAVLVTSIDRISRSLTDCTHFVRLLKEMDIRLFTADQGEINLQTYLRDGPAWLAANAVRSD